MAIFIGNRKSFPQRLFTDPEPSRYVTALLGEYTDNLRRSEASVGLIREDVKQFGKNRTKDIFSFRVWRRVYSAALEEFHFSEKVLPYHINDIMDMTDLECMDSAPGIPWHHKTRRDVANDPAARQSIRKFWHFVKTGKKISPPDCKAYVRVHVTDDKPKVRGVWGYPTTMTFAEAQFALPLIEKFKEARTPIAYGYNMASGGARRLFKELLGLPAASFACLDFKSFDKSVPATLIDMAFKVLYHNINFTQYKDQGIPHSLGLKRVWHKIVDYFKNTTIRLCTGEVYAKKAGVPSGSYFTQLIDSIVNWMVLKYVEITTSNHFCYIRVFGDDSVIAACRRVDIDAVAAVVNGIGMEISTKKSFVTTDVNEVEFLGFKIENGFPRRPFSKWMAHLYWPEVPDYTFADVQSRALGLLYANAAVDANFHGICAAIVRLKTFELSLNRSMKRFLASVGVDIRDLTTRVPTHLEF